MKGQLEHKFDETFVIVSSSFPVVQLCCHFYFSVLYTCCTIFSGGSVNALSPRIRQVGLVAASLMAHFFLLQESRTQIDLTFMSTAENSFCGVQLCLGGNLSSAWRRVERQTTSMARWSSTFHIPLLFLQSESLLIVH